MYEFLALESCAVHLCERLRALRSVCSTTITISIKVTSFGADKKSKINKRLIINGSWK